MILSGDIGGTNARFALFEDTGSHAEDAPPKRLRQGSLKSADFAGLGDAIRAFLGPNHDPITAATFGVAGAVLAGKASLTNLAWEVDAAALGKELGIPHVTLLNDLVALAFGAISASQDKLRSLRQNGSLPARTGATVAVIAAGTGLGEATLVWDGARHVPCATEGGHVDFAPRNRLEFELLEYLQTRFGDHVSYERVVAGPGIGNLYDFFVDQKDMEDEKDVTDHIARAPDRNKEIAELGASGKSRVAVAVMNLFVSLYGAEAGNLALKSLATGGVFVCGGIASHYADLLARGEFLEAFAAKGRFAGLLGDVPVAIVTDSDVGLSGSAFYASRSRAAR